MGNSVMKGLPQRESQDLVQQIKRFGQTFQGNPKQAVMQMLNSGQITNPQLQQAMSIARQIQKSFK